MATTIIPKKSTMAGKIPDATSLSSGEIAINLTDGKIYAKHTDGSIVDLTGALELHTHSISQVDGLQSALDGKVDSVNGESGKVVLTTDDVGEGTSNNYWKEAPSDGQQYVRQNSTWSPVDIPEGYTTDDFSSDFSLKTTTDLSEGTNLYFTNARARSAISVSGDLSYTNGVISFNETYSTASELLTAIKTVDGSSSGLDADLLDGKHASAFATSAQGSLADSAVQPADLSTVATTGSYNDLTNKPDLSVLDDVVMYTSQSTLPTTGESGKVYIAEDTGYMYRWNGTGYTQLTDQTAIWGQVSGTLADQTDLQSALNGKANSSHSHSSGDLPSTIMYEGEAVSLLANDANYINASQAPVQSVNGATGAIVLDSDDVSEGTSNLFFTNTRARSSISVSGDLSYTSSTGVISFNETYSTASELLAAIKTVDGGTSGLDADLLDGQHGAYYRDWTNVTNKPSPTITLSGDVSGSGSLSSLTDGTITTTVSDDSHNHTTLNNVTEIGYAGGVSQSTVSIITSATTQTELTSFNGGTFGSSEIAIQGSAGNSRHLTKLLVVHDGTTASATEYGVVTTTGDLFTVDVDFTSPDVRILVTPTTANNTAISAFITKFEV